MNIDSNGYLKTRGVPRQKPIKRDRKGHRKLPKDVKMSRRRFIGWSAVGLSILTAGGLVWKLIPDHGKYIVKPLEGKEYLGLDYYKKAYELRNVIVNFEDKRDFDNNGNRLVHSQAYRGIINELLDPDPNYVKEGLSLVDAIESINKNKVIKDGSHIKAPIKELSGDELERVFREYVM